MNQRFCEIFCLVAAFCLSLSEGKPFSREEESNEKRQFQVSLHGSNPEVSNMVNEISNLLGGSDVADDGDDDDEDDAASPGAASVTSYHVPAAGVTTYHSPAPYGAYHAPAYTAFHSPAYATSYHQPAITTAYHQPAMTTTYHHPAPFTSYHAPPFPAAMPASLPSFSGVPSGLPSGYGYQAVPYGYQLVTPGPVATHFEYHQGAVGPAAPAAPPAPPPASSQPKNVSINLNADLDLKNFPTPAAPAAAAPAAAPAAMM